MRHRQQPLRCKKREYNQDTTSPWQTEHNTLHIQINEINDVKYQILHVLIKEMIGDKKIRVLGPHLKQKITSN
jgi:hypothetical protein